jgi:uncharacterized protein (TIGR02145 family)
LAVLTDPVDSVIVKWESSNPYSAYILYDTLFSTSEVGQNNGKVILNITTIASVMTTDRNGSASLSATISCLKNREWRTLVKTIPRQITISAYDSNTTYDKGVTINGVTWAARNVNTSGSFVDKPEDLGLLYQWNSKINWDGTFPPDPDSAVAIVPWRGSKDAMIIRWKQRHSSVTENSTAWDKTNDPCPKGWRMPKWEELQRLFSTGNEWHPRNGVGGYWFYEDDNLLFLPAAGYLYDRDGKPYFNGTSGNYWSDTTTVTGNAYALSLTNPESNGPPNGRNEISPGYGLSCRCVKDNK